MQNKDPYLGAIVALNEIIRLIAAPEAYAEAVAQADYAKALAQEKQDRDNEAKSQALIAATEKAIHDKRMASCANSLQDVQKAQGVAALGQTSGQLGAGKDRAADNVLRTVGDLLDKRIRDARGEVARLEQIRDNTLRDFLDMPADIYHRVRAVL